MATKFLSHSAELYHYGIKGMKWGKRLFGPSIYTQKKKLKYDNNQIWKQDESKLNAAKNRAEERKKEVRLNRMKEQFSNTKTPNRTPRGNAEVAGVNKALQEAEAQRMRKRHLMEESAKKAHSNAVMQRYREAKGRDAALAEQEKLRAERSKSAKRASLESKRIHERELLGRHMALSEQKRQKEARKRKRLADAVSRNARYYKR